MLVPRRQVSRIFACTACDTVTLVHPNIRVQKYLRDYLVNLTEELKRLEQIDQSTDVLENIKYLLELIAKLSPTDEGGDASDS